MTMTARMLKESSIHRPEATNNMHARKAAAPAVGVLVRTGPKAGEDDDERHHGVAEDSAELIIRLLEEPVAAHAEGDLLPARVVLDPRDLNPSPPHAGDLS